MPRVSYSVAAIADIKRLKDFLAQKDITVAKRAITAIRNGLDNIVTFPERHRPIEGMLYHREALINFGSSGYVARFRHLPNGDITIARIRHQLEDDYPE